MVMLALAELLLRRKELNEKVSQLNGIQDRDCFKLEVQRRNVAEGVDDVVAKVPLVSINEITRAYDYYAKCLRRIDALIQRANWETQIDTEDALMNDYEPPVFIPDERKNTQRI